MNEQYPFTQTVLSFPGPRSGRSNNVQYSELSMSTARPDIDPLTLKRESGQVIAEIQIRKSPVKIILSDQWSRVWSHLARVNSGGAARPRPPPRSFIHSFS
jgi:hypothetical protein